MVAIIEHRKFVCSDSLNNNNKFWEYMLRDDGTVVVRYGRIGKTANEDEPKHMSRSELDTKIREKLKARGKEGTPSYKPPYKEIAVVTDSIPTGPSGPVSSDIIKEAAKKQLARNNDELTCLVERLVEANRHELVQVSGGQMDIDLKTGIISTPVGVITKDGIKQARDVLNKLSPFVQLREFDKTEFIQGLNDYLMLVPQQVGHARGWHKNFFNQNNTLIKQSTLLDQLDASADLAVDRLMAAKVDITKNSISDTPNLFNADIRLITDVATKKKIEKLFMDSINTAHESRKLRPVRYYEVMIKHAADEFNADGAKLSNIWMLWHGTRMFNVLSILKNSLIIPKSGGTYHVTGRMFGDGLYFSDQSTKSLNYSYGGVWDRGARDKNCFMFLVDVAMGNHYTPDRPTRSIPKEYDSMFAKANVSGVVNNEMIVYRTSQVNPRYLIEFEER